jgi:hypothetical protein
LFTNGILFGKIGFCKTWLPSWKKLGLTNIAVSLHSADTEGQISAYNIDKYPKLQDIKKNIEKYGIGVRGTLLLRRNHIDTPEKYKASVHKLIDIGFNNLTSWPVVNHDGTRNEYTPSRLGLWGIRRWLNKNAKLCHGHVWGGGVYDYKGNILRYTDYVTKHSRRKNFVRQLVVFQDGTVAYSWIKEGALCLK